MVENKARFLLRGERGMSVDEGPLRPFGPLPPEGEDLGVLNLPPLGEVPAKPE